MHMTKKVTYSSRDFAASQTVYVTEKHTFHAYDIGRIMYDTHGDLEMPEIHLIRMQDYKEKLH